MTTKNENQKPSKEYKLFVKVGFFLTFFLPFCWTIYFFGPRIVFYFDQQEGIAELTYISRYNSKFNYFHKYENKKISLSSLKVSSRNLKILEGRKNWEILYSKRFPNMVSLKQIHPKPNLVGLFYILLAAIPLIFFKNFELDKQSTNRPKYIN